MLQHRYPGRLEPVTKIMKFLTGVPTSSIRLQGGCKTIVICMECVVGMYGTCIVIHTIYSQPYTHATKCNGRSLRELAVQFPRVLILMTMYILQTTEFSAEHMFRHFTARDWTLMRRVGTLCSPLLRRAWRRDAPVGLGCAGLGPCDAWIPMVSADRPWIPKFYSIRNVDTLVL
jgi:hypothetical protein